MHSILTGSSLVSGIAMQSACRIGVIVPEERSITELVGDGFFSVSAPLYPTWNLSKRVLGWPNGSSVHILTVTNPDSWRGINFDFVWAAEVSGWSRGSAADVHFLLSQAGLINRGSMEMLVTY